MSDVHQHISTSITDLSISTSINFLTEQREAIAIHTKWKPRRYCFNNVVRFHAFDISIDIIVVHSFAMNIELLRNEEEQFLIIQ